MNRKGVFLFLSSLIIAQQVACTDSLVEPLPPSTKCSTVVCPDDGSVCSETDGLCHCGDTFGPVCSSNEICFPAQKTCQMVPKCTLGTKWESGKQAFVERTKEWGLEDIGAQGIRLASGDFNNDGWPDLLIRSGGNREEDLSAEGTRRSWLLLNDTAGGFRDITKDSRIRAFRTSQDPNIGRPGEVVAFADVDNDGTLDVFTGMTTKTENSYPGATSEVMLNDGKGTFSFADIDSEARAEFSEDAVAGASFVDYDRDGNIDLWLGQTGYTPKGTNALTVLQDRLLRGNGLGFFSDVTNDTGLVTEPWSDVAALNEGRAHSRSWSSLACDLNNDGTAELLSSSYGRAPNLLWQGKNENGVVSFTNRSVISGYAFDDQQDWSDNEFAKCFCEANPMASGCGQVPAPRIRCPMNSGWSHTRDREPFRLGGNSGTTVCADINNDGYFDLLTTEITHWWAGQNSDFSQLLLNEGSADVSFRRLDNSRIGLSRSNGAVNWDNGDMTAAVFDFDNDGWQDIYIGASDYAGNRGLLYHQSKPLEFSNVSTMYGIDHNRSHGLAVADFDRDGDLDIIVGHSRSRCDAARPNNCYETRQVRLFENVIGAAGNWVQLSLIGGDGTNRKAIGARVTLTTDDASQSRYIDGGHGHYGIQHDALVHFGLGSFCEAEVKITWPDKQLSTQTFNVVAGFRYRIEQGQQPTILNRE
ncbi:MAG: CRTAC1 family protein [Myxococcota bacterium]|nr:CRTAC1 family protein [Myxococcota bacterium]